MTVKKAQNNSNFASDIVVTSNYDEAYDSDGLFDEPTDDMSVMLADDEDDEDERSEHEHDHSPEEEIVVLDFGPGEEEFVFKMPEIPGAPGAEALVDEPEIEVVIEPEQEPKELDPWDWKSRGLPKFVDWLRDMINKTPQHSGQDVGGLERAISYFEMLIKEVSKAMRSDYKGEIDIDHCEGLRADMHSAVDKMNHRLERVRQKYVPKKTSSWVIESGLVKEAQKSTNINGITIVVPLFISRLARVLINGTVSAGHSLEDMYDDLKEEYDLTKREEAELQQLMADMGYTINQDRGLLGQQVDKSKSDNRDWAAAYNG